MTKGIATNLQCVVEAQMRLLPAIISCQCVLGFNVYEDIYARPKYSVVFIDDIPFSRRELFGGNSSENYTYITKNNVRYACHIPQAEVEIASDEAAPTMDGKRIFEQALEAITSSFAKVEYEDVDKIKKQCLFKTIDYWTYQFCYGIGVKQFHEKPLSRNHIPDDSIMLYFLSSFKDAESQMYSDESNTYNVLQRLTGGLKCDLTGRPRTVDVHYLCGSGIQPKIIWVEEFQTCRYEVLIGVPELCGIEGFDKVEKLKVNQITCRTIDDGRFEQYRDSLEKHFSAGEVDAVFANTIRKNKIQIQDYLLKPLGLNFYMAHLKTEMETPLFGQVLVNSNHRIKTVESEEFRIEILGSALIRRIKLASVQGVKFESAGEWSYRVYNYEGKFLCSATLSELNGMFRISAKFQSDSAKTDLDNSLDFVFDKMEESRQINGGGAHQADHDISDLNFDTVLKGIKEWKESGEQIVVTKDPAAEEAAKAEQETGVPKKRVPKKEVLKKEVPKEEKKNEKTEASEKPQQKAQLHDEL